MIFNVQYESIIAKKPCNSYMDNTLATVLTNLKPSSFK